MLWLLWKIRMINFQRLTFSFKIRYFLYTQLSVCIACWILFFTFFIKGENKNCVSIED